MDERTLLIALFVFLAANTGTTIINWLREKPRNGDRKDFQQFVEDQKRAIESISALTDVLRDLLTEQRQYQKETRLIYPPKRFELQAERVREIHEVVVAGTRRWGRSPSEETEESE